MLGPVNAIRTRLILLIFLAAVAPLIGNGAVSKNVLLVIADDFGADSQSLYNTNPAASLPPTPHINALAARGVRFAHAYAYPVCSPTRSAILTGRYAFRTGVDAVLATTGAQGVYTNEFTLPERLSPALRCGSFGKWHLGSGATGPNVAGGWPNFAGALPGSIGQSFYTWTKVSNGVTRTSYSGYATTDNVNDALAWLSAQGTNRWFLWLAFNAPHTPHHLPPTNLCPHYAGLSGTATDIQQNPRRYYEAAVEAMDTELGRLLSRLDTNETTVLFTGDNGTVGRLIQPPFSTSRGKDTLYEGGVRIPLIAAGPAIVNPGRVSLAVVHVVDLFATILELAGQPLDGLPSRSMPVDARSLVPILRDETFAPAEDAVLVEKPASDFGTDMPGRTARRGDYKLIAFASLTEEFYHLATDPLERTNLLSRPLAAEAQASLDVLRAKLAAWRNVPIVSGPTRSDSAFRLDVAWFVGHDFSLWRNASPVLASAAWLRLTNAPSRDLGTTIRLTDPTPPAGGAVYRVRDD